MDEPEIQSIQQKTKDKRWMSLKKEAHLKEEKRHNYVSFQMEKARLRMFQDSIKSKITTINSSTRSEENHMFILRTILESDQRWHDNYLSGNKKRAENALIGIQQARDTELELDGQNEALIKKRKCIESKLEQMEGVLSQYTRCKDILFKMSPVEWQEAQMAKALEKRKETGKSPSSGDEDDHYPALFTSAPEDLLGTMSELTEQNVSLIQNAPKVDDTLEELNQSIENTSSKVKEVEEKVTLQILDLRKTIDEMKTSTAKLKQTVFLYESLKTANEDIMLNALKQTVSKTYSQCMDRRPQCFLTTLDMLANIESRMCTLLDQLESVPKDFVEKVMKLKERERRSRQLNDQLQRERQKQEEKVKKCMHRAFMDPPKKMGRKLMPRCIPVESHAKEEEENVKSEEDDLEVFLFGRQNSE